MSRYTGDPQLLKRLPPFSWFSETQLAWALPTIEHRRYPPRTVIQRYGEAGDGLYIVLSGRVCVLHQDAQGHELIAASIGANDFVGELGLLENEVCAASIRCDTACEMLYIPRKIVLECLEDNGRAAMCMLKKVILRLCDTHRKLATVALTKVYDRVAAVLLEHSRESDGERRVEIGSEQISSRVAASREMVSRVIKDMIGRGMVRRDKRKLVIVDAAALAAKSGLREPCDASPASDTVAVTEG
jgi:CRP/FNR family transcriptional regulator, cyclic AMP receptor protein